MRSEACRRKSGGRETRTGVEPIVGRAALSTMDVSGIGSFETATGEEPNMPGLIASHDTAWTSSPWPESVPGGVAHTTRAAGSWGAASGAQT
jgi:hypothetical protein